MTAHPAQAADGDLSIFHEVLQSLLHEHPLEQTLDLISRRVSELAGFSFCGVLLPDEEWRRIHLAGGHGVPQGYAARMDDIFLVPVGDRALAGSPTRTAIQEQRTVVMSDALADADFLPWRELAREFGYRSVVSVPLLVERQVIGVLNGYSRTPREYTRAELVAVESLAAQAAIALRLTMLVESRQETIDALQRQRSVLERSHDIHLRLTTAVIEGADFEAVAQTLADLIGRGVAVTDARGRVLCTSTPPPEAGTEHSSLAADIRIGAELLGRVAVAEGDPASRDLDLRAVEHGATVLALEIVKERVARATEERLRSDFLSDLLSGRDAAGSPMAERARHYGLTLGAPHRVLVVALDDWAQFQERRDEILRTLGGIVAERLPGAIVGRDGDALTAAVPIDGMDAPVERLTAVVAEIRRRVEPRARGLSLTAGIGGAARAAPEFHESHRRARQCVEVLHRLGRGGETMATDELGILGLFVDHTQPEQLTALADGVLGPMLERDRSTGGALRETLAAYLDAGCDARATAARLYVHHNTVKYRLRRIEQLCALDLRDPDDLLRATIAMLVLRIV